MDKQVERMLNYLLFGLLGLTLIFIVFRNLNNPWGLILLSGLLFLSFIIKQSFFYGNTQYRHWEISCLVVDLAIIFWIGYFSTGSSYQIYYLVLIAYVALSFSVLKSSFFGCRGL